MSNAVPVHLNSTGCRIGFSEGKGRGVFATRLIPAGTVVEISPVLLLGQEEYNCHARFTILDNYTFNWPDGRMALALGLGSLFNHSQFPNISFMLDTTSESIRYMATQTIQDGEELCIFYGHKLWFKNVESSVSEPRLESKLINELESEWTMLPKYLDSENPFLGGKLSDLIEEIDLPVFITRIAPDEDDDGENGFLTIPVWVVDVPDPRRVGTLLKWLARENLGIPELNHLRRVRRSGIVHSLLLSISDEMPVLPPEFSLLDPYIYEVPATSARDMETLKAKCNIWPTIYAPRRKNEPEKWSRAKAIWAWNAIQVLRSEAIKASEKNELPIISYIPSHLPGGVDDSNSDDTHPPFVSWDMRCSAAHPLRHSALNLVRQVADWRASSTSKIRVAGNITSYNTLDSTVVNAVDPIALHGDDTSIMESEVDPEAPLANSAKNGGHYLLTGLTVFITHEPCIMCSMALLHSRVKEVIYVVPMDKTGGCGGSTGKGTCVPRLKGVNHRFAISRWKALSEYYDDDESVLKIDEDTDV